jgi:hypothetical protein
MIFFGRALLEGAGAPRFLALMGLGPDPTQNKMVLLLVKQAGY